MGCSGSRLFINSHMNRTENKTNWGEVVDAWKDLDSKRVKELMDYNRWCFIHPERFRMIHKTTDGDIACGTKYDPYNGTVCALCKAKQAHKSEAEALEQYWKEY